MSNPILLANDKYYAELTQAYTPGDTTIYLTSPPDNVPTLIVVAKGTANETIFQVLNKTMSSVTGVTRVKGANVEFLIQTPVTCLNNADFINQYRSYLGIAWKGEWDNATAYELQDGVSYNNSSYVCIQSGTNHLPTDTDYWQIVGVQGSQGIQGNPGVDGLGVPAGGATGEVLKKKSNSDNDTEWGNIVAVSVTTKGDLQTHDGSTPVRLPVVNGKYLKSNSATDSGLEWVDLSTTHPRSFTFFFDGYSIVADEVCVAIAPQAMTVTKIWYKTKSGTATIRVQKGTTDIQNSMSVTSSTGSTTSFLSASLTAGDIITLDITAVNLCQGLMVCIECTQ